MTPSWIELDGADNVRDLGGLPLRNGGRTRPGVLVRSDGLDALSEDDVRVLVDEVGLRHVIDLRSVGERADRGRGRLGATAVTYTELEVIDDAVMDERRRERFAALETGSDPAVVMAQGYAQLLEMGSAAFTTALHRLTDGAVGVPAVVHCSAGKDRTGVLVALLLDAVGVQRESIVADYAATQARMPAVMSRLQGAGRFQQLATELPAFVLAADAGTMRWLLDHLDRGWGGAAGWFVDHGAGSSTLEAWRDRFIEP